MAAAISEKNTGFKKGFPKEIINGGEIDQKYQCGLCNLVLRNPIQSFCGHRFCEACIHNLLTNSTEGQNVTCPPCEEEETLNEFSDLKQTFPDNAIKREFANLTAKCINEGCSWDGPFKAYIEHEPECEFQLLDCECGKQIAKHEFEEHKTNECPRRIMYCPYCNASVMAKDMEAHEGECPLVIVKCQGCGKEGLTRFQLTQHQDLENGDCEAREKICPLHCGKAVEPDLKTHLSEAPIEHMLALMEIVDKMDKKLRNINNDGVTVADCVPTPPLPSSSDFERLFRKVTDLENKLKGSHRQNVSGDALEVVGSTPAAVGESRSLERGRPDGNDLLYKVRVTDTKVVQFEDTLAVIRNQLDCFREEADEVFTQNRELKAKLEAQEQKMKNLEKSVQLKDIALADADLKITALELTSYDGVITWKITDFARKRQEAIAGRMTSIYSPPFYTSKTGYKMCARLYINGDGMGRNSHMSLFFVVNKGKYDALLKWPFRQKVTLQLLDQNQQEDVLESFRPDPNSSSFRRPTSDMNIASGCPLFCQLSLLDQAVPSYVKDDTMFIRISVDIANL